jgi:hypothetical protein
MKEKCLNCKEHSCIEIINGIGICRDPECIFIHNTILPSKCAFCGDTLPSHFIHEYCASTKYRNTIYLKTFFNAYKRYREMGDISSNG